MGTKPDVCGAEAPLLRGLRVLDLTMLLPGPLCTMLLADWGAEVIKIEPVSGGDRMRRLTNRVREESAFFLGINRNKKSLAIDLRRQAGRDLILQLAETADVFLEGLRPGKIAQLGLDHEALTEVNPGLIYCSLSGYGQAGPWANRAGHDANYLALSGLLSLLGEAEEPPSILPIPLADITGALMSSAAILAALWSREHTSNSRRLDLSLHESIFYCLAPLISATISAGAQFKRGGTGLTGRWPCYNVYSTRDNRYMTLGALEPHFWADFCRRAGREDWIPFARSEGAEGKRVRDEVSEFFAGGTLADWITWTNEVDVCCEPVLSLSEAVEHPQALFRGLVTEMSSETEGSVGQVAVPVRSSPPCGSVRRPPPRLGEHTIELLLELGYGREKIDALAADKVVATVPAQ